MHLILQIALVTEAESLMFLKSQNVQYTALSDFEIVRPAKNEQDESSGSFCPTQEGCHFQPN